MLPAQPQKELSHSSHFTGEKTRALRVTQHTWHEPGTRASRLQNWWLPPSRSPLGVGVSAGAWGGHLGRSTASCPCTSSSSLCGTRAGWRPQPKPSRPWTSSWPANQAPRGPLPARPEPTLQGPWDPAPGCAATTQSDPQDGLPPQMDAPAPPEPWLLGGWTPGLLPAAALVPNQEGKHI